MPTLRPAEKGSEWEARNMVRKACHFFWRHSLILDLGFAPSCVVDLEVVREGSQASVFGTVLLCGIGSSTCER